MRKQDIPALHFTKDDVDVIRSFSEAEYTAFRDLGDSMLAADKVRRDAESRVQSRVAGLGCVSVLAFVLLLIAVSANTSPPVRPVGTNHYSLFSLFFGWKILRETAGMMVGIALLVAVNYETPHFHQNLIQYKQHPIKGAVC